MSTLVCEACAEEPIDHSDLYSQFRRQPRLTDLRHPDFESAMLHVQAILDRVDVSHHPNASPRQESNVFRVGAWNIECGLRFSEINRQMREHALLGHSVDCYLLTESDRGMSRSNNRRVDDELAANLGFNRAFFPAFIELSNGYGFHSQDGGTNTESLQGQAILTPHPILRTQLVKLPKVFEYFHHRQKRIGDRVLGLAEIRIQGKSLVLACTHLEPRTTVLGRAQQMRAVIDAINKFANGLPVILGGDLNTTGVNSTHIIGTIARLALLRMRSNREMLRTLRDPEGRGERLLTMLRESGFRLDDVNVKQLTCYLPIDLRGQLNHYGAWEGEALIRLERRSERTLKSMFGERARTKVDWIASKGIEPAVCGTPLSGDSAFGLSIPPTSKRFRDPLNPHDLISDHRLLITDFDLNAMK